MNNFEENYRILLSELKGLKEEEYKLQTKLFNKNLELFGNGIESNNLNKEIQTLLITKEEKNEKKICHINNMGVIAELIISVIVFTIGVMFTLQLSVTYLENLIGTLITGLMTFGTFKGTKLLIEKIIKRKIKKILTSEKNLEIENQIKAKEEQQSETLARAEKLTKEKDAISFDLEITEEKICQKENEISNFKKNTDIIFSNLENNYEKSKPYTKVKTISKN